MSDVERRLLGRMLSAPDIAEAWEMGVRPEQFVTPLYQAVFVFTVNYWQESLMASAPTPWVLAQEFKGYVPAEGIEEEVFELALLMRRRYLTNQLQTMLRDAGAESKVSPEKALRELYASAYAASEVIAPRLTRVNMAHNVEERRSWEGRFDEPQAGTAPFGIQMIDEFTGRIRPGELAIVGGFAKTGKTMFLCNAAVAAVKQGLRPIVFTLEVTLQDMQQRLDAFYSKVSYSHIVHDRFNTQEQAVLHAGQDDLASIGGIQVERPEPGDRTVGSLLARTRQVGANYVLIDQLSRLEPGRETYSTKQLRAIVLDQLHNEISRAGAEVPCLMAGQFRRETEEPSIQSFADAAEVEREVDFALGLHRNMELRRNHQMRCDLMGSRRSDIANFMLNWELTNFTEITGNRQVHDT